jgi:DNA-binding NtrC family response regulator
VSSDTSLLITGETGVGKEWLARGIHADSPRRDGPFVAVNCGALPETLLESELFGHEEGAFTGATRVRRGLFETAHGGTIFLDEIGEMPLHLQVKLLRVLESREVQRVGAEVPLRLDVRVMAASNRDLEAEVEAGGFRPDLYYRLGVVTLAVPALRERREDIPTLARSYIDHFSHQFPHTVERIAPEAMAALVEYDWPGNVRELMNVIERAMLLCEGRAITSVDLPDAVGGLASSGPPGGSLDELDGDVSALGSALPDPWLETPLKDLRDALVASLERAYLSALLERTRGRVGETARRAGIDPRSLYAKMRRLGLRKEDYR